MNTPVVIFIYQRTNNWTALARVLSQVKPLTIYLVADGPKNSMEKIETDKARVGLESLINWQCQIHKNYAKTNLGLKERFRTGIDWVFQSTDRAIFLEDDCIPDPTFFKFCDELLDKYKDDERIFSISGNNFQFGKSRSKDSYYYSKYPHIWGWATWKRSWDKYDGNISDWGDRRKSDWLRDSTSGFIISKFWKYIFDRLSAGKINTWDYQLTYASFKSRGLNIIPSVNLVTNVGYGKYSTNIKSKNQTIGVEAVPMAFPLVHPINLAIDDECDRKIENLVYLHPLGKLSLLIKSLLGLI